MARPAGRERRRRRHPIAKKGGVTGGERSSDWPSPGRSRGSDRASMTRRWALVMGVWSSVGLFSVAQIYIAQSGLGHPPPVLPLLVLEVPIWAFWACATIPIVMLARRAAV